MQIHHGVGETSAVGGPSVVSVGNFDGVHLGHRFLLGRVVERARELQARAVAVTFEPHPTQLLRPEQAPKLITPTLEERLSLLATTGIDAAVVLPFTTEFSQQTAEAFAAQVLVGGLRTIEVHEGGNFRFGYRAQAGVEELRQLGTEHGFGVQVYAALRVHGIDVSSSRIRKLVAAGDVRRARWLLGRPFAITGTQASGRGIGTKLTVPTINFAEYAGLVPGAGVYVTRMQAQDRCWDAVTNVGTRPTFADGSFAIETHLLDFRPTELPEATPLRLTFLARLREERRWPSPEALREQIGRDVARARRFLRHVGQPA